MKSLLRNTYFVVGIILSFGFVCSYITIKETRELYPFPVIEHFPKLPKQVLNQTTTKGVELGRFLFYDSILSIDTNISCASCHRQYRAFSYSLNYLSHESDKKLMGPRNILPLFNLAWQKRFFWDGRAASLEGQASVPLKNEMGNNWKEIERRLNNHPFYKKKFEEAFGKRKIDSALVVSALAQFERTILSYNSKYDRVVRKETKFTADESEGLKLATDKNKGNCFGCHSLTVSNLDSEFDFSNNGLVPESEINHAKNRGLYTITKNPADLGKFKIPSLRNLFFTDPFMHDGRFHYMTDVLNFYSSRVNKTATSDARLNQFHSGGANLTAIEKRQIIAFLNTLNDTLLLNNTAYSNPFTSK